MIWELGFGTAIRHAGAWFDLGRQLQADVEKVQDALFQRLVRFHPRLFMKIGLEGVEMWEKAALRGL